MKTLPIYRHGEVMLRGISELPQGLKQETTKVFMIGSHGHDHSEEPLKYYNCFCPTTGREYYIGTAENTCVAAKNKSFGLEEIEFINEW